MVFSNSPTKKYFCFLLCLFFLACALFFFFNVTTTHAAENVISNTQNTWDVFYEWVKTTDAGLAEKGMWQSLFDWLLDASAGNVFKFIAWLLFTLSGWFLTATGFLLDSSIELSTNTETLRQLSAIDTGWVVVRDLANIFFIFFLLYMSIATIV